MQRALLRNGAGGASWPHALEADAETSVTHLLQRLLGEGASWPLGKPRGAALELQ